MPRLEAAAALALSGVCLDDSPSGWRPGLQRLEEEIERQILPDGGHVSRSPEALLDAYRYLDDGDGRAGGGGRGAAAQPCAMPTTAWRRCCASSAMATARWRCSRAAQESDPRMIAGLLARDEVRGQPFRHARHSGYQRLAAGRTLFLLDCGEAPQGAFALRRPCRLPGL